MINNSFKARPNKNMSVQEKPQARPWRRQTLFEGARYNFFNTWSIVFYIHLTLLKSSLKILNTKLTFFGHIVNTFSIQI